MGRSPHQCRAHLLCIMSSSNDVGDKSAGFKSSIFPWTPDFTMYKLCDSEQVT